MDPTSDLVNALDELIAAIQRTHEPSESTDWLHRQREELVVASNPETIDTLISGLTTRLPDLYDEVVVAEGDHSLRAAFANVATWLRAAGEDGETETLEATPAVIGATKERTHAAPAVNVAAATTETPVAPQGVPKAASQPARQAFDVPADEPPEELEKKPRKKKATVIAPGEESERERPIISSVAGACGLILLFVSISRIALLNPFVCGSSTATIALWLGFYGSLAFGTLTLIIRTVEIQRVRKLGLEITWAGHSLQLLGIIEMASFALVVIMFNLRHCSL